MKQTTPSESNRSGQNADPIQGYIERFPPEVQAKLQEVRRVIRECVPGATETISYGIPTFDLRGKHLVHFAAFAHHLGFYPTPGGIDAFQKELVGYKSARGSVQFVFEHPIPLNLIRRMVLFRVKEVMG